VPDAGTAAGTPSGENHHEHPAPIISKVAVDSQQPTANSQQPTANSQQPTANSQQPTGNRQQATGNRQQATANRQQATGNRQQATGNRLGYVFLLGRGDPPVSDIPGGGK
jgi:hypothetical protein